MNNTGIILTLAYPDTIVMVADEWYSPLLRLIGIGKKNYVRAGHAALVLINTETGILEYHDFGRYITPEPYGRVRGRTTDNELELPLKAEIVNGTLINLEALLKFLATHPKLTHGEGRLVASVAKDIDYIKARAYIDDMQDQHFIKYAAFEDEACNCARFVTDAVIAGTTNAKKRKQLIKSKWFTPSTVGNVLLATDEHAYEVSETGVISIYKGSQSRENIRCFFDTLKEHSPNFVGSLEPSEVEGLHENAQWLSGIAAGAWFELHETGEAETYRFRRVSPYGHVDCDALYLIDNAAFNYEQPFKFVHYSNCKFFKVEQDNTIYHFTRKEAF